MPTAVLAFDFDPFLHVGDSAIRWETVGIAAAVFAAIVLAGVGAGRRGLRVDDLLFVVLGIVPGAVVGGRIGYVLLHAAFFSAEPSRILDPGVGSLELTLAVVGGCVTGALVAVLLDGRPGAWLQLAALPTLLALALGKLATVLGGTGQGVATTGEPATAYLGAGPWGSLGPAIPSVPSGALEGLATIGVLVIVAILSLVPGLRRSDGRLFVIAVGLWAVVRGVVASTWRDPVVAGPLRAEQLIAAIVALGALAGIIGLVALHRGDEPDERGLRDASREPAQPRFATGEGRPDRG
ncbi:MAG TPA: prolipoprotein diacylglyceryl transferase family protein [Candidatus Limnocylindrales bacterium]|nr:prolipoprotein diacylglyceryl transferase family protein [Candidatus Limnocylindrales bacterium]